MAEERANAPLLPTSVPILLYTHTQLVGGVAGYVMRLAQGLRARGYRVGVLCRADEALEGMRRRLVDDGVAVHAVEMDDSSRLGRVRRVREFIRIVRQYRGCVLALMMGHFFTGALMTAAGVLGGARTIVRGDLQPPEPSGDPTDQYKLRLRDLLIDRTVVGSAGDVMALVREAGLQSSKVDVVHTGIDLSRFDPTRRAPGVRASLGLSPETTVVGVLSRLEEDVWRKGIDLFLEMAARVGPQFPGSRFLIVGDGPARPRLEAQAEALGVGKQVIFAGWRSDVPDVLSEIDVFVMPSLREGGPTTVLEAMAMGRPVVSTAVGMVPEVVEHGQTGLIVAPGDVDAMSSSVSMLLADPALRSELGARARIVAERSFGYDAMVRGYLEAFADALDSPRAIWRRLRRQGAPPNLNNRPTDHPTAST